MYDGAAIIPPLFTGYIGYQLGGKFAMLMTVGLGAWFARAFYGLLVKIWRVALYLGILVGTLAVVVYVSRIFWDRL